MPNKENELGREFYVTGGNKIGRIMSCKVPFCRGNGLYKHSMKNEDWEIHGNKTLTDEEKRKFMEKIRDHNMKVLRETVRQNKAQGYELEDAGHGYYRIVRKEK